VFCGLLAVGASAAAMLLAVSPAVGQTDNFDDGNDTGWTRYDPIGSHPQLPDTATYSVVNGTYRIRTTASPLPDVVGPARAGSIRRDVTYTDFYVTVDLVDWDETLQQSVGILGRVTDVGLGTTDGYVLTYNFRGQDIDITRFTNEDPTGGNLTLTGADDLILEKGKKYRMVFWGRGPEMGARIFDLAHPETPLLDVLASDTTYASGFCGLLVYDNSAAATMTTDATFDNYFAVSEEPPRLEILDLGFGAVSVQWPGRAANFKLESTDRLGTGATWIPVNESLISYFADIDRFVYQGGGSDKPEFFRLKKP